MIEIELRCTLYLYKKIVHYIKFNDYIHVFLFRISCEIIS